jgi:hypothetical protein
MIPILLLRLSATETLIELFNSLRFSEEIPSRVADVIHRIYDGKIYAGVFLGVDFLIVFLLMESFLIFEVFSRN